MKKMNSQEIITQIILSILTNVIAAFLIYLFTAWLSKLLKFFITPSYIFIIAIVISASITLIFIARNYEKMISRWRIIQFLSENSATKSFDLLLNILASKLRGSNDGAEKSALRIETMMKVLNELVSKRRQPMQVVEIDCKNIIDRATLFQSTISLEDQLLYYLDFIRAYKKMALTRIIRQVNLYTEAFKEDEFKDYVMTYGHSSIVVEAIISSYRINPFPIIVVEDLQYHEQSLQEHQLVTRKLKNAGIQHFLIKFDQIRSIFDIGSTSLTDQHGKSLPLLRKRRLHAFIGCERIDLAGNTLVPSELKGLPSETAQFVQEMEAFSSRSDYSDQTVARIVILAESYKVRDYDKVTDLSTNIPLHGRRLGTLLYILGIKKKIPNLYPVTLFSLKSNNIYSHINELGIFPNINKQFNLSYCKEIFESETNLLGFFTKPKFLIYRFLDNIQVLLFDLNGVIANDEELHYQAFQETLQEYNIEFSSSDYDQFCRGRNDLSGFKQLRTKYKITAEDEELVQTKRGKYKAKLECSDIKIIPGADRVITELRHRGYKIGLVTASSEVEMDALLKYQNLRNNFDVVITDEDVVNGKPAADGYMLAARQLDIPFHRCLVIEDSPECVKEASIIGMKTVGIKNGRDIQFPGCNYICNSLEELLTV